MTPIEKLADQIAALRDSNGCWNVLDPSDKNYPQLNYYVPNYRSTLWTLILLAEMRVDPRDPRFHQALTTITSHFYDQKMGIFSVGKSHFPIPCLNGNMLYLLSYFGSEETSKIVSVIDFFSQYHRFDDGDFKTPRHFPDFSNKSCYGRHTCYWGVVKLLKGLAHLPWDLRNSKAEELIQRSIEFILLHKVCFGSHNEDTYLCKGIQHLTFPSLYHSDFLEILWVLAKAKAGSKGTEQAIALLKSKMSGEGQWAIEKRVDGLLIPLGKTNIEHLCLTARAREVLAYFGAPEELSQWGGVRGNNEGDR